MTAHGFDTSGLQRQVNASEILDSIVSSTHKIALLLIGGCGGSGKSTLAGVVADLSRSSVVHLDDFARPNQPGWDEGRFNEQVIVPLSASQKANYQRYDWDEDRLAEWHVVEPDGLVVIEGVTALTIETRKLFSLRVWVDAPRSVRLARGVERDGEAMRATWTDVWMREEDEYAWKHRRWLNADFVVDGTTPYL